MYVRTASYRSNWFVKAYTVKIETASKSKPAGKQKQVVLSIDDKIEILKLIDKTVSYLIIMDKYIWDWKNIEVKKEKN